MRVYSWSFEAAGSGNAEATPGAGEKLIIFVPAFECPGFLPAWAYGNSIRGDASEKFGAALASGTPQERR